MPDIRKTSELVQEISAASREQDTGADQINQSIRELDRIIRQNAEASQGMAATATVLSSHADRLQNSISFFKVEETGQLREPAKSRRSRPNFTMSGTRSELVGGTDTVSSGVP